jgi:hypothetical protein
MRRDQILEESANVSIFNLTSLVFNFLKLILNELRVLLSDEDEGDDANADFVVFL